VTQSVDEEVDDALAGRWSLVAEGQQSLDTAYRRSSGPTSARISPEAAALSRSDPRAGASRCMK
jgi:hypothetical protein